MVQQVIWDLLKQIIDVTGLSRQSVRALWFFGFFVFCGIAIYFNRTGSVPRRIPLDRSHVRKGFLAGFFCFLLVPGLVGLTIWPHYQWSPLDSPGQQNTDHYDIYVVDTGGDEIRYDARAVPPLTRSPILKYGSRMARSYDNETNREFGAFLLDRARSYRTDVAADDEFPHPWTFPRGEVSYEWSSETLSNYDEFVAIRVYEYQTRLSEDGSDVEYHRRRPVLEITERANGTVSLERPNRSFQDVRRSETPTPRELFDDIAPMSAGR